MEKKHLHAMILCTACGFNAERKDIVEHNWDHRFPEDTCLKCKLCEATPMLREAYRRGFNAGLDALKEAVKDIVKNSNLRKASPNV